MKDCYDREIDYLRLSITDLCNYRCLYCMPPSGVDKKSHLNVCSYEEYIEYIKACTMLGIKKVRLTGGEPLIRKGVLEFVDKIKKNCDVETLSLTTNAFFLKDKLKVLKKSGLDRINISLDTLDEEKYRKLTRGGDLKVVKDAIDTSLDAGFENLKVNAVLMRGFNDTKKDLDLFIDYAKEKNITVRFIELMPIGFSRNNYSNFFVNADNLKALSDDLVYLNQDGVAQNYSIKNSKSGKIGFISSISHLFCGTCSRIRITCDGKIRVCLCSDISYDIRGLHGSELLEKIKHSILQKPKQHEFYLMNTGTVMSEIGG